MSQLSVSSPEKKAVRYKNPERSSHKMTPRAERGDRGVFLNPSPPSSVSFLSLSSLSPPPSLSSSLCLVPLLSRPPGSGTCTAAPHPTHRAFPHWLPLLYRPWPPGGVLGMPCVSVPCPKFGLRTAAPATWATCCSLKFGNKKFGKIAIVASIQQKAEFFIR